MTRIARRSGGKFLYTLENMDDAAVVRFTRKIAQGPGECIDWIGARTARGYGSFTWCGKPIVAHRFTYQLFKGAIPFRAVIDHMCNRPQCVNPDHLEAVSPSINARRGYIDKKRREFLAPIS